MKIRWQISTTMLLMVICQTGYAQKQAPPLLVSATDDKAFILLLNTPQDMKSFIVSRKGAAEKDFTLLTPEPITGTKDPLIFRDMLGEDYSWVARTVKAENELQALRRINSSPGNLVSLSLSAPKVALALGRMFVDSAAENGQSYTYKVTLFNYSDKEIKNITQKIKIQAQNIKPPAGLKADVTDGKVALTWDYAKFSGKPDDNVAGFKIYRAAQGEKPRPANRVLLLRQDERLNWTDRDVQNGENYTYYLTAVDIAGQESAPSNKIKAAPLDATAPFPPREVKAVEEENLISIVWDVNMEPDLDHYDIFRATGMNLEYTKLNKKPIPADAPRWSDENVMSGPTYYYKVKAYDKSGNESAFSAPAFGKPVDKTPPGKPKNLTFKLENHEIVLQWKPPQDPDLRGYYIYRAGPYAKLMRIVGRPVGKDTLFYTDAGMTGRGLWPGQTYEYAVASVDWAENIGEKAVIKVTVPDDEAPQKPTAMWARTTMEGEVRVSWQPSLSLDIAGYRIFRGPAGESAALKPITTVPDSVRKYNDKNVEKGVRYAYQVAAVDAAGNESEKTDSVEVTPQDAVAPPEPENVKAVVRDGKVVLTWTAVDAADLKGYNIYKSDQPSGQYKRINSAAVDKTQFVDNNGQAGAYYRVTSEDTSGKERKNVRAVKAEGES